MKCGKQVTQADIATERADEIERLRDDRDELQREIERLRQGVERWDEEDAEAAMDRAADKIERLRDELDKAQQEIERLRAENEELKAKIKELVMLRHLAPLPDNPWLCSRCQKDLTPRPGAVLTCRERDCPLWRLGFSSPKVTDK
jgi:cell division protein FtsB